MNKEIIIVRSLTDSDLGIFAAHRPNISSKQRAININSNIANRLLPKNFEKKSFYFNCRLIFGSTFFDSKRHFGKVGKNWRLGGNKIRGDEFGELDSRDFALIRSVEHNNGSHPIYIFFISRKKTKVKHAQIVRLIEPTIKDSMDIFREGSVGFSELAIHFTSSMLHTTKSSENRNTSESTELSFPPMPRIDEKNPTGVTIREKVKSPHIFEQMIKASSDLSAPAQLSFIENVTLLSQQLRDILIGANKIVKLKKDHPKLWNSIKGKKVGFVDGGLANLSMLGSVPIVARVGGYTVIPGDNTDNREQFIVLKKLINEMFSDINGGVYNGSFPDIGALRDAARISIEAAGAVHLLQTNPKLDFLFVHGALINPVSRYSDVMVDGKVKFKFPDFSDETLSEFLQVSNKKIHGKDKNFIKVYLKQLKNIENSTTKVCGIIEREASTTSVIRAVLKNLSDHNIAPYVSSLPPADWKKWFLDIIDPSDDESGFGQRIFDSLLFRCVLEPGEALLPVVIDRNEIRKAPNAWKEEISHYPKPMVSYLNPSEWTAPFRIEIFEKDESHFEEIANLIYHCALLLPKYAFPAGLDIVDKFAKIPNWISRPVNTNTTVQALKRALYKGDEQIFDSLRRMLCGSTREWLLRPNVLK